MTLRDQVEQLLPGWQSWYPSVFDAAVDLGLLRARVCAPGTLLLSQRHAAVYSEALQAFREKWSAVEPEEPAAAPQPMRDSLEQETDAERVVRLVTRLQPRRR